SNFPFLTPDARFVVFGSFVETFVSPPGTNGKNDIFIHDLQTGATEVVSVSSAGDEADQESLVNASVSGDGRYVAFASLADNLVHDRQTGVTDRVSVSSAGAEPNNYNCCSPTGVSISGDGRFVAFNHEASNLVPNDTNGSPDVFVHDRLTGITERVSVDSD